MHIYIIKPIFNVKYEIKLVPLFSYFLYYNTKKLFKILCEDSKPFFYIKCPHLYVPKEKFKIYYQETLRFQHSICSKIYSFGCEMQLSSPSSPIHFSESFSPYRTFENSNNPFSLERKYFGDILYRQWFCTIYSHSWKLPFIYVESKLSWMKQRFYCWIPLKWLFDNCSLSTL